MHPVLADGIGMVVWCLSLQHLGPGAYVVTCLVVVSVRSLVVGSLPGALGAACGSPLCDTSFYSYMCQYKLDPSLLAWLVALHRRTLPEHCVT